MFFKGDDHNNKTDVVVVVVECVEYVVNSEQLKSKHSWMDRKIKFSKYTLVLSQSKQKHTYFIGSTQFVTTT